ncbi:MAG: hypothetical protein UH239_07955 [Acutalibacteraceae bacterium]|nr:hypothetical protein [Acutalibacteraceae bacterium]
MDNNNKQNNYNPYGNSQNGGFENNSQYNQQYYGQNNLNQVQ